MTLAPAHPSERGGSVRDVQGTLRVIVAPHHSEIGGSQLSALELAGALSRQPGMDVALYLPDGAIVDRARALDLELHLTTLRESAPSPGRIGELGRLASRTGADLVHAYEWAPTIDAAYGAAWRHGVPVLSTILSMDYPYFLPPAIPVVMGTRMLHAQAVSEGRRAYLLEPPVDTDVFDEEAVDPGLVALAREECGAGESDLLIVVVGRLAARLKLDGLLTLAQAVGVLASEAPVHLAIVGDGPARAEIEAAAAAANAVAGREVVRVLGSRPDPAAYYLAADIAVGMGSSALRAMSLGRALVVQGEAGFWAVVDERSAPVFAEQGWFGVGDGRDPVGRCLAELRRLLRTSPRERAQLGKFGRSIVEREYSLERAAQTLAGIYREVSAARPTAAQRVGAAAAQTWELSKFRVARRWDEMRHPEHAEAS
jgi:glycosyltransferase involved in cell wall biosynthesis